MAPEILAGKDYDNKVDIWSLGTVLYELLFGRVPYNAGTIVDLLENINSCSLEIPRKINNISLQVEQILKKMLVVDPKSRISWEELFNHNINHYFEE
jgi:serine/threonine-protein kinase ULK2